MQKEQKSKEIEVYDENEEIPKLTYNELNKLTLYPLRSN
jgi:hypothetical protein